MSHQGLEEKLKKSTVKLLMAAAVYLPKDVKDALEEAYRREKGELQKKMLLSILENLEIAEKEKRPLCQDTGAIIFYVKVGENFPYIGLLPKVLREATAEATELIPLRPNVVDVITGKNTGNNVGKYLPWIDWEIVPDADFAEITVMLKGGGSEAVSMMKVLTPAEGLNGALKAVLDTMFEAGPRTCPPNIVSLGIGATGEIAAKMAKRGLLRPVGERHPDPKIAEIEERLLEAVNTIGWGVHGTGGGPTALDVHVEVAERHPATFAVSVMVYCWAARRATMRIAPDGKVSYPSHSFLEKEGWV
ncbi:MAG: hypothetical protein B9J98_05235 [Candidatus Terraquivivens tikiterensis]|uniref:Fe-S hydro-lyase tartrate dehydratase alpha-type catalytic domain-containing protein n=1 Tax=Candidatus Terraquivivens tikiterensis TaxID=1980982 RepID=A0A2R7Y323_9ARCH|nr:MAG: hypothetical protein B9J98_05235 [Candidatus Terraquivivens tikiterensis]